MKWLFYVIVFVYMVYRSVYGAKSDGLIVDPVSPDVVAVGERITISCKPTNKNQKVDWIYPNGTVVKRNPKGRVFSQEHFVQPTRGRPSALMLTVTNAMVLDSGVYQCRSGDLIQEVTLCVIELAQFMETPNEVTIDLGRSITLSCQAKGDPEPSFEWKRNDDTIIDEDSSGKYKLMTKYNIQGFEGQLTIMSSEAEDSGIYSCVSIQRSLDGNCSHINTKNITLNVKYAPTFKDTNETTVYGQMNEEIQMVCSAQGFPIPTYRWFKEIAGDTLLEFDQRQIKFSEETNEAILAVELNSASVGEKFKCQATNDQGTSEKYFTLMKVERPKSIDEVKLISATPDTVALHVTWYDKTEFPVNEFVMQYVQDQNGGSKRMYLKDAAWRRSKQSIVNADSNYVEWLNPKCASVVFTELNEMTSFWMRLRVSNDAGYSAWSDPMFATAEAETSEETEVEVSEETQEELNEPDMSDASFYGIFFAGGILVVAFVCMLAMRMVK